METLTAPPAAPDPTAPPSNTPEPLAAELPGDAEIPRGAPVKVKEPPPTVRELLEYVVMLVAGVVITAVTIWFYRLIQ